MPVLPPEIFCEGLSTVVEMFAYRFCAMKRLLHIVILLNILYSV